MGDAGSYLVGTALALLLAFGWSPRRDAAVGFAGIALVALPVIETGVTIIRRIRARHPLFQGDRGHVYDQLVDRGRTAAQASLAFSVTELALGALAVAAANSAAGAAAAIAIAAVAVVVGVLVGAGFTNPDFRREAP
jgi:UDP-N-acetylmuramyl pentapeptide phosphotransferase/UDP-N-acetylglucosamine-1-phosphate transferase